MTSILSWFDTFAPFLKPVALVAYAAFLLLMLLRAAGARIRLFGIPRILLWLLAGAAVLLMVFGFTLYGRYFVLCAAVGVVVLALEDGAWRNRALVLQSAAVVAVAVSLAWWLAEMPPRGWLRVPVFGIIAWCIQAGLLQNGEPHKRWYRPALYIVFAVLGFAVLADTTSYQAGTAALVALMHHQGAYIGSALHIRAGLVPFYDVPLQYGLGPTMLIAAALGLSDCWTAMAFLCVATSLILGLLILRMALDTKVARGSIWSLTVTIVIFAAVFLWPGFANWGSLPTAAPSVSGMRYLPATLVAFLLFFERTKLAAAALVPAVLWSPEVAFMSLAVYGVYETSRLGFIRAALRALAISAGSIAAFAIVHRLIYGIWIEPQAILEYILHVPEPLPIQLLSDFLFLAAALGLAVWNVYRTATDVLAFRRDLVVSTLLFAATSYYLGRSHPNNACNLMPFMLLVALRSLDGMSPAFLLGLPRLAIIGMSTAVAVLSLSLWVYTPFRHGFSISTDGIAAGVENVDNAAANLRLKFSIPDDVGVADIREIRGSYSPQMTVWTPVDPGALWRFVPSPRRQLYIRRSAARLHKPGWIILDEFQQSWLDDFSCAYRTGEVYHLADRKRYLAAYLTPLD